jgi:iron complex transport system substrate-binding protein
VEAQALTIQDGWTKLAAVANDSVFVVDGNAYFSRPGPRLVDSIEILAGLLHPEACPEPPDSAAVRLSAAVEKAGRGRHN